MPARDIKTVMDDHVDELMTIDGVVGVYLGELSQGVMCIKVMVAKKTPELEEKIPQILEGHSVVIDETGEIRALEDDG